ncbi:major facilitator superfamily domain-containing protein 9 isoform X3 [Amyelois transitella]|uniref:major facilitator superfamily domain-containing protein 9 isoform X3 n=1 Tax=Amyelois transitella TaxID=680683 RepID=UPI0029905158|nr:major facilitator superfamily domain-containing protein 9 isoform X3 [Amyelois transitella]
MLSPTTTLQIVSFLDMLTIGLLMPQLGNQAIKLGASQILLGTMGALYSGLQMVSEPMIGSLSDVKGRKPILMLILIFCGFAYLIQGLTTSLVLFFVIRGFLGLIRGLPDINATKDKKSNEITDGVSPKLLQSVTNSLKQSIDQFYQVDWSVYWDAFIFKLILSFCMAIYFSNFAIFLTTKHNATPIYIGYIISFQGIISAICTYFIGFINKLYVKDKDYSQRVSHIFLILTVSQLGMAVAPSIYVYVLFVIPFAVAGAISRIVELEMIVSKGDSERRGSVIGALGTLRSLAGVVTPLVAGFIAQYLGVTYTVLTAAFLTSIGVVHSYNSQNVPIRPKRD